MTEGNCPVSRQMVADVPTYRSAKARFRWTARLSGWNDHRQDEDFSSSCRVTGVSSLNLALPPPVCRAFFLVAGRNAPVISKRP